MINLRSCWSIGNLRRNGVAIEFVSTPKSLESSGLSTETRIVLG